MKTDSILYRKAFTSINSVMEVEQTLFEGLCVPKLFQRGKSGEPIYLRASSIFNRTFLRYNNQPIYVETSLKSSDVDVKKVHINLKFSRYAANVLDFVETETPDEALERYCQSFVGLKAEDLKQGENILGMNIVVSEVSLYPRKYEQGKAV